VCVSSAACDITTIAADRAGAMWIEITRASRRVPFRVRPIDVRDIGRDARRGRTRRVQDRERVWIAGAPRDGALCDRAAIECATSVVK
jgi:hypothetical protein